TQARPGSRPSVQCPSRCPVGEPRNGYSRKNLLRVNDLELCGGLLLKSGNTNTVDSYALNIYVRAGDAWNNALSTMAGGSIFLSRDSEGKFKALVLSVS